MNIVTCSITALIIIYRQHHSLFIIKGDSVIQIWYGCPMSSPKTSTSLSPEPPNVLLYKVKSILLIWQSEGTWAYLGLPGWTQYEHKTPSLKQRQTEPHKKGNGVIHVGVGVVVFENRGRGHEPMNAGVSRSWKRWGNRHVRNHQKEHGWADTIILGFLISNTIRFLKFVLF